MVSVAPTYWIVPRDDRYAIHDTRGPVPGCEGIETSGEARAHVLDLIAEARDEAAAQADYDAQLLAEAAAECEAGFAALLAEAA